MRKAVFFDRDGILVEPVFGEAPTKASDLRLIHQILPVIKYSKEKGYLIFVVSNQPDIALGLINEEEKKQLEEKFEKLLEQEGIKFDKIYYCHHNPSGSNKAYVKVCECQKPKPGMLLRAKKEFDVDMKNSFMVGDRASDIKAGKGAGTKTILFDQAKNQDEYLKIHQVSPDYRIKGLPDIEKII